MLNQYQILIFEIFVVQGFLFYYISTMYLTLFVFFIPYKNLFIYYNKQDKEMTQHY